jgi:NTE family protein
MAQALRTAFVFAGGGSLGAVEVGMLRELVTHGEQPDMVVGASAGAINAAHFAGCPDTAGILQLQQLWSQVRRRDIMPLSLRAMFGMLLFKRPHLVDVNGMRRLLTDHLPYQRIENARLPLHIVATDMQMGDEVVLSQGLVVDAVLASAAIPGIFPPVRIDGRDLVDGGVANNTPISVAVRLGAQRIIVLPAGFACALRQPPVGAIAQALHALSLLVARQLVSDMERYATVAELFVVPPLCPLETSPYDYSACAALIERAAHSTRSWLQNGGLLRPAIPGELRQHQH